MFWLQKRYRENQAHIYTDATKVFLTTNVQTQSSKHKCNKFQFFLSVRTHVVFSIVNSIKKVAQFLSEKKGKNHIFFVLETRRVHLRILRGICKLDFIFYLYPSFFLLC